MVTQGILEGDAQAKVSYAFGSFKFFGALYLVHEILQLHEDLLRLSYLDRLNGSSRLAKLPLQAALAHTDDHATSLTK